MPPNYQSVSEPVLPPTPPQQQQISPPIPQQPQIQPKKSNVVVKMVFVLIFILGLAGAGYGGYYFGNTKNTAKTQVMAPVEISLPQDATLTAECVENRGKQYVLPKDIPIGPIYDVFEGKVIAIEYLVDFEDLEASPDKYTDLGGEVTQHDHVAVIQADAHAGLDKQHFHVVNYFISPEDAKKITCASDQSDTTNH